MNVSKERLIKAAGQAKELLASLSLTEKVGQLSQFGTSIYNNEKHYYEDHYKSGTIGSFLTVTGAALTNKIQKEYLDEAPHKIPLLFAEDVIHGYHTVLPTPLAQSCSWDPEAAKKGAEIAAKEAYAEGVRWTFSPMVDIARDPRWGRIVEGYGEDPYLCSRFAEAVVRGYQGDEIGEDDHVLACMKHFVGYGACVGGRDYDAVEMSEQTLHDLYLPSFKAGLDAGAATVMSAFHTLNGVPCTGNHYLLTEVLRDLYHFDGFVVSDAGAVTEMIPHGYAADQKETTLFSLKAGLNMLMAGDSFNEDVPVLLAEGKLTEAEIDTALLPILTVKYLLGLFDRPYTDESKASCLLCEEHRAAARKIAEECPVLLENNGILPLDTRQKIALIGPLADNGDDVLGPWSLHKKPETTATVRAAFRDAGIAVTYAKGSEISEQNESLLAEAVNAAENADVAVLLLGEREGMSGEAQSRGKVRLPRAQQALLDAVLSTGTPVVLLIGAGRPLIVEDFRERVAALAYIWQLGTETGPALVDVLTGKHDMCGHLTTSVVRHEGQIPTYYNRLHTGRPRLYNHDFEVGYKDMPNDPRYPFGYGLSYTAFAYSDLRLSADTMKKDGAITVTCAVKNTGSRAGTTVAQLYVRDLVASVVRPIKELKGFQKISLAPGESKTVSFTLEANALAFHNQAMERVVEPGDFMLWVGQHAEDETLPASFTVTE